MDIHISERYQYNHAKKFLTPSILKILVDNKCPRDACIKMQMQGKTSRPQQLMFTDRQMAHPAALLAQTNCVKCVSGNQTHRLETQHVVHMTQSTHAQQRKLNVARNLQNLGTVDCVSSFVTRKFWRINLRIKNTRCPSFDVDLPCATAKHITRTTDTTTFFNMQPKNACSFRHSVM